MENLTCKKQFKFRLNSALVRWLAAFAFLLTPIALSAASFTASLDRSTISFGDSATLSLTFEDGKPDGIPSIPSVGNLQINYIGQSSQFRFENGRSTSQLTYTFSVTPRQPGDYTIPAITTEVDGRKLTSPALQLKVLKPTAPSTEAINSGNEVAFLKLVLPKKEVYLGEVIAAELQIFYRQDLQLVESPQLTSLPMEGMSAGKTVGGQRRPVRIGNATYYLQPASIALTAIKTGPLTVGPITVNLALGLPARNFQEQFFGGRRTQMTVATELETLQCLPVPEQNRPPSFNGAVGNYTININAGPTNVATGDPITVRVQISGRGALDGLSLPEQSWHDFKTYPPTSSLAVSDQLGLQGTKSFEQIVVPQTTDVKEIPPFAFSFFDPDARAYRTLTHPAIQLTVRPGGTAPAPVVAVGKNSETENPPPQQGIVPIKQHLGSVAQISVPLVQQPWFWFLQSLPVLIWLGAWGWRKRTDALANNPRLRRQRQVAQTVREGLNDLRRFAAEKNSEQFFATLFRLLQEQLGERLDCPASAITEDVVEEKLRPRGVPDSTLVAIHELFQTCNQARYAPVKTSQELNELAERSEQTLREIQAVKA